MSRMLRFSSIEQLEALRRPVGRPRTNALKDTAKTKAHRMPAVKKNGSRGEFELEQMLKADGLPQAQREYRFHPTRGWRFDFAWPALKLAVEVEGGIWQHGRHNRGDGFQEDLDKYNEAVLAGFRVLRFSTEDVHAGIALAAIKRAFTKETT